MQIDQIYDSGKEVTGELIDDWFLSMGVKRVPDHYREFLFKQNGGYVHHSASEMENGDSLIRMFPLAKDGSTQERVELAEFDSDESSVPANLLPAFKIGSTWDSELFLSVSATSFGALFLYSLSYDELVPTEGTIFDLLRSLKNTSSISDVIEPDDVTEQPWSWVRTARYKDIYAAIDHGFDINSASTGDPLSRTCLMFALQGRRRSLVEGLLRRGADGSVVDANEKPTLFYSSQFLDGLIVAKQTGIDLNATDRAGDNMLHFLAKATSPLTGGETRIFGWLIENGVDGHAANSEGDRPVDILNRKIEDFKTHYVDQPYMADFIPTALLEKIKKLQ